MSEVRAPVAWLSSGALALVVIGGVDMAGYAPRRPPLVLPALVLALAAIALVSAWALMGRVRGFAWRSFHRVFRWALLAYVVAAGGLAASLALGAA